MKESLITLCALLFLFVNPSAFSEESCILAFQRIAASNKHVSVQVREIESAFAEIPNPQADDFIAAVKSLPGNSQYQLQLVTSLAPKVPDLDGAKLVAATNSIQTGQVRAEAVAAGFAHILNPQADDLVVAMQSLHKVHAPYQLHLIKTFAPKIPDLDGAKLVAATNWIYDGNTRAQALSEGFKHILNPKAVDLVVAVKSLNKVSAPYQLHLIKTFAANIPDLDGAKLVEATNWIYDGPTRAEALAEGFAHIRNPKADDLVVAVKSLNKVSAPYQLHLIKTFAANIPDLDGAKLVEATNWIYDGPTRAEAVLSGFGAIRNPTMVDLDAAMTSLDGLPGAQVVLFKKESSRINSRTSAQKQPGDNPTTVSEMGAGPSSPSSALDELKSMPGMGKISEKLAEIKELLAVNKLREAQNLKAVTPMLHAQFNGNPGTGKTTVARIYGKMLRQLGFLKSAENKEMPIVERAGSDFVGPDAVEKMEKAIAEAQGGVLVLDELYAADPNTNRFAKEASAVLLKAMEDKRDKFVVVSTGYSDEMEKYTSSNPGFKRRFAQTLDFADYDNKTLADILKKFASEHDYQIDENVLSSAARRASRWRGRGFGNAGTMRNYFEAAVKRQAARLAKQEHPTKEELKTLQLEDFMPPANAVAEKLAEIEKMEGNEEIKKTIRSVVAHVRIEESREKAGLPTDRPQLNAVFEGNAGTGKTTLARKWASLLKDIGYVSKGELVEVKGSDLVGDVIGASERKTREVIKRAQGNVLFIDEAYKLFRADAGGSNSFGQAALDTLVGEINADGNQDMIVILAGYPREMAHMLSANPGLARRFPANFHFVDYTPEQLSNILLKKAEEKGFDLSPAAQKAAAAELKLRKSAKDFGNAGEVENLLGAAQLRQSARLAATGKWEFTTEELRELRPEDFSGPRVFPDEVLKELDPLPGLISVKQALHDVKDSNEEAALADESAQGHLGNVYSFEGHSLEDQKTVAETLGKLLRSQGILPKDHLEIADASDLKGQFTGDSAVKTKRILEASLGKTLLIRGLNAISNPQHPYEKEVLDTLKSFLQQNRGKLAVVFSGTPDEVENFARLNPKLAKMIEQEMVFHDLSPKEGLEYINQIFQGSGRTLSPSGSRKLAEILPNLLAEEGWGNAANLEQLKSRILIKQAVRCKRVQCPNPALIDDIDVEAAIPQRSLRRSLSSAAAIDAPPVEAARERLAEPVLAQAHSDEGVADPQAAESADSAEHDHAHDHQHAELGEKDLAEAGIKVSDQSRKLMQGIEDIIDGKDPAGIEDVKESIRRGELSQPLLEKLASKLNVPLDPESLSLLKSEAASAIREFKAGAKMLKEAAKTNEKARQMIKHYICLACGRSTCGYMPYTWFTEE